MDPSSHSDTENRSDAATEGDPASPTDTFGFGRRTMLKAIGAGAALSAGSGVAAAGPNANQPNPPVIDPTWGYNALSEDDVSPALAGRVDHTVELKFSFPARRPDPETPMDFIFDPVGLHVQPGDVVKFLAIDGEHTTTAYHADRDRQNRVPDGVQPFSSPMHGPGMVWLYRFDEEGVHDFLCGPHEVFGMVGRIVVGDETSTAFGPGFGPLAFAADVFAAPELDPTNVIAQGSVEWGDLTF